MTIYILKTEGTSKIPDYIQVRNEDFTLIAYFKMNSPLRALARCNLSGNKDRILKIAGEIPYGKVEKVVLD
jgi:hypothetical protein